VRVRVVIEVRFDNIHGGKHSSGCSRLKLMISASECILVVLKSRMNSVRHSLNSESAYQISGFSMNHQHKLTNNRLKAIFSVNCETGLAR
jgi:hypothetical protein